MAKQYGLIKTDKSKVITRLSIFNESSDSDDNSKKPTGLQDLKRKEKTAQDKVLAEDPTVYQYDEVYDEIQSQRKEAKLARKDLDKKPKYINKLLEAADRRKRENERRIERQVQKEREEEGDMYKDKESFVTSSYRQKLEEMKALEEKEIWEDYLEQIGDVKKQGDLSGFYRHLYAQQVNYEEEDAKQETRKQKESDDTQDTKNNKIEKSSEKKENPKPKRKYRKREDSKSSEDEFPEQETKLAHLPSNLDADSDFSIDSDSDTGSESETKKPKLENISSKSDKANPPEKLADNDVIKKESEDEDQAEEKEKKETNDIDEDNKENGNDKNEDDEIKKKEVKPKKPKIDIWQKRTVGEIFDDAIRRFYERKANRVGPF